MVPVPRDQLVLPVLMDNLDHRVNQVPQDL